MVELAGALEWFELHADSLAADLRSAHYSRGEGGSQWMANDDRELRADFRKAIERARAVLTATPADARERARAVSQFTELTKLLVARRHLVLAPPSSGSGRKSISEWREFLAERVELGEE